MNNVTWNALAREVTSLSASPSSLSDAMISGVEYDSRHVQPGSVFVAMRGGTTDGNHFIEAAFGQGAAAVVTDSSESFESLNQLHPSLPHLFVNDGRTALAQISAAFFQHPERHIKSTGVTGTNGKTTTAFLIESILNQFAVGHAPRSTILVGTIEYHVAGEVRPSLHTTPESRDLFELMSEGTHRGATELVMEVSSHALAQGRVAGVPFDVAVFTNLTRDHLDFHGSMEQYFEAKKLLFSGTRYPAPRVAVINANDAHAPQLLRAAVHARSEIVTYGLDVTADWRAERIKLTPAGAEFHLTSPYGAAEVQSGLAGEVNVSNLLAALAATHARGVQWEALVAIIPALRPVPGRFQSVHAGQPFTVIVDYAHTDDALRNLTALARQLVTGNAIHSASGRVITLFGCGGDRDRTKRPKMGIAAGEGSDLVVVTSDNPRSEDPAAIIEEILPGVTETGVPYIVEPDRARAISLALAEAHAGDVVLLAGKGHEKVQILRQHASFFDDAQVAISALHALGYGGEQ